MSIFSLNISNVSRASGASSCASLSYIIGQRIRDERLGLSFDYGHKERILHTEMLLPKGADFREPAQLFNEIEKIEKADNARTAKKIRIAFPQEFSLETQIEVIEKYIQDNLNANGYAATYAIHNDKENHNPHAHILVANRQLSDGEWAKVKTTSEFLLDDKGERIPLLDENGQQKTDSRNRKRWKRHNVNSNLLDKKDFLEQLRSSWADIANQHLPEKKLHIDHRSYKRQGVDIEPTIHEGYVAREIERAGGISDRCEHNRQVRNRNLLKAIRLKIADVKEQLKQLFLEKKDVIGYSDVEDWAEFWDREDFADKTTDTSIEEEKPLIDENRALQEDDDELLLGPVKVTDGRSDTSSIPAPTKTWDR